MKLIDGIQSIFPFCRAKSPRLCGKLFACSAHAKFSELSGRKDCHLIFRISKGGYEATTMLNFRGTIGGEMFVAHTNSFIYLSILLLQIRCNLFGKLRSERSCCSRSSGKPYTVPPSNGYSPTKIIQHFLGIATTKR